MDFLHRIFPAVNVSPDGRDRCVPDGPLQGKNIHVLTHLRKTLPVSVRQGLFQRVRSRISAKLSPTLPVAQLFPNASTLRGSRTSVKALKPGLHFDARSRGRRTSLISRLIAREDFRPGRFSRERGLQLYQIARTFLDHEGTHLKMLA